MNIDQTTSLLHSTIVANGQPASTNPNDLMDQKARKTAAEFESFFLSQFIETMNAGIATDGPFGGGHGEKVFRSMQSQEYAKSITRVGGIGIAEAVYREILKLQEGANS